MIMDRIWKSRCSWSVLISMFRKVPNGVMMSCDEVKTSHVTTLVSPPFQTLVFSRPSAHVKKERSQRHNAIGETLSVCQSAMYCQWCF